MYFNDIKGSNHHIELSFKDKLINNKIDIFLWEKSGWLRLVSLLVFFLDDFFSCLSVIKDWNVMKIKFKIKM